LEFLSNVTSDQQSITSKGPWFINRLWESYPQCNTKTTQNDMASTKLL